MFLCQTFSVGMKVLNHHRANVQFFLTCGANHFVQGEGSEIKFPIQNQQSDNRCEIIRSRLNSVVHSLP